MNNDDYKRDIEIIEAAADGPWYTDGGYVADKPCCIGERIAHACQHPSGKWLENSEYIAHFNPAYTRQLVEKAKRYDESVVTTTKYILELEKHVEKLKEKARWVDELERLSVSLLNALESRFLIEVAALTEAQTKPFGQNETVTSRRMRIEMLERYVKSTRHTIDKAKELLKDG